MTSLSEICVGFWAESATSWASAYHEVWYAPPSLTWNDEPSTTEP